LEDVAVPVRHLEGVVALRLTVAVKHGGRADLAQLLEKSELHTHETQ
jgi:hypothetical protein